MTDMISCKQFQVTCEMEKEGRREGVSRRRVVVGVVLDDRKTTA